MRKREPVLRHFALAGVIALIGYIAIYSWMEHRRTHNGPWQLTFTQDRSGGALLIVNEPGLGITNVSLLFLDERSTDTASLAFEQPIQTPFDLPFGRCVFMDLMALPGTLVLEISGHEIQLLPRVLTVDKKEHAWESDMHIVLSGVQQTP